MGAILCLGMSSLFHTVCCHSETVSKLFNKLDYVGISLLTVGSFVPWLYYSFYCEFVPKLVYMIIISVLGIGTITITMMDRFTTAAYRYNMTKAHQQYWGNILHSNKIYFVFTMKIGVLSLKNS